MSFTESEIRDYNDYADTIIAEFYPLIKKAVSSHAATYMKKNMLKFKEQGPDKRMDLEENKAFSAHSRMFTVMPQLPPRFDTVIRHTVPR